MSDIYTLNSALVVKTRPVDSFQAPIYVKETSRKSILYLGSKICNQEHQNFDIQEQL